MYPEVLSFTPPTLRIDSTIASLAVQPDRRSAIPGGTRLAHRFQNRSPLSCTLKCFRLGEKFLAFSISHPLTVGFRRSSARIEGDGDFEWYRLYSPSVRLFLKLCGWPLPCPRVSFLASIPLDRFRFQKLKPRTIPAIIFSFAILNTIDVRVGTVRKYHQTAIDPKQRPIEPEVNTPR